jgi:hypothetical protein
LGHRPSSKNAPRNENLPGSVSHVNNDEEKIEEALMRRRFDEWTFRGVSLLFPIVLAMAGWALTLETRMSEIATQQMERAPRIFELETTINRLTEEVHDPRPNPETKVTLESIIVQHKHLEKRIDRIEDRLNSLHNYLLIIPRPPFKGSQRGDVLRFPSIEASEFH